MSSEVKRYEVWRADAELPDETMVVLASDYDALEAECDKLAKVLENVEREHDLIRQMKNCEIRRDRRSFGIAVMSDPLALEWQALDKELQQFIDARRAALAASTGKEAAGHE